MKKNLLLAIVVLASIAMSFSSCFVERGRGYGSYGGGGYHHGGGHHHW